MSSSMSMSMRVKLSLMMFLQFMMLPVWFIPMFAYVKAMPGGEAWGVWCGSIMAFGAVTSPLFGMIADRFFNSERVLALCNLMGAVLLGYAYTVTDPQILFFVLVGVMLVYMPTWSLTATIAMENSTTDAFPSIRVFGSLGWVAAGVFSFVASKYLNVQSFDQTPYIFLCGAGVAVIAAVFALFLPRTLPKAKGQPMSVADTLGLRAVVLFKRLDFAVFAILIFCAMIPFQWYMAYTGQYLKEQGYELLTITASLGQVCEIAFMLMIPFILKKAGYKWGMVLALGTLAVRYVFFYLGAEGAEWANYGGILVHGLIFGMLIVGSQMYVDSAAPQELRAQAQGLIGLIMFGAGALLSNLTFEKVLNHGAVTVTTDEVVKTVSADGATSVAETLTQVTKHDWSTAFLVALVMAVVLAVAMAVLFNPKKPEAKA